MLLSALLAVLAFSTPVPPASLPAARPSTSPYLPVPCKLIVHLARLEGKTVTRHNLALMFEQALTMHGGANGPISMRDIGEALIDMASARSCLSIPPVNAPSSTPISPKPPIGPPVPRR